MDSSFLYHPVQCTCYSLSSHVPYSLQPGRWYVYQVSEKVLKNNACGTFTRAT